MNVALKRVYIKSYGCQMNIYDSRKMLDLLQPHGYVMTDNPDEADLAILNTCHIREKAEQKMYSDLGRLHNMQLLRRNDGSDMVIAVGGCVGQAEGDEIIRHAPYVSMVFGPQTYHRLPEMLAQIQQKIKGKRRITDTEFPAESKFDYLPAAQNPGVSAFVSVQEGCDKFCTFCVVPYTRGAEYSRPAQAVLDEVKALADAGVQEITLLGQNVNAYHGETAQGGTVGLGRLMELIALQTPSVKRLRYTTSHPRDMDDELIFAHRDIPAVMPFLHLPVQSGSDLILKEMNRKHTAREYLDMIARIRNHCPQMQFSSDFITGFPGESDKDHQDTLDLVREVGYAQAYSFKYSPRPGTPAAVMEMQVDEEVKARRLQELQELLNVQQLGFNRSLEGTVQEVLFDRPGRDQGQILGKTPWMQSVYIQGDAGLLDTFQRVRITHGYANSLTGELVL